MIILLSSFLFLGCLESYSDNRTLGYQLRNHEDFEFNNRNVGDNITIIDTVKSASYDVEEDITKVYFSSYDRHPILFKGDLTSNYFIQEDTVIEFEVRIIEQNGIQYIEDFFHPRNTKGDVDVK